jgi:hypothetical protein
VNEILSERKDDEMTIVAIEYVDYGVAGEHGVFGKVVARSDVRGMTEAQRIVEIREMRHELGDHIMPRVIEEVAPCHP